MTRIRIADDYASIREAMLRLAPKAPAIVHAGNLMPVSAAHFGPDRYAVTMAHQLFANPRFRESWVGYDDVALVTMGGRKADHPLIAAARSMPRMTAEQIDRWNSLRSHTGLRMRPVIT